MTQSKSMIQSAGLDPSASMILINNLNPVNTAGAQGVSLANLQQDDITILVRILDESGSMSSQQLAVIAAANEQLDALKATKVGKAGGILISTYTFNMSVNLVHSFVELDNAVVFDTSTYNPNGGTALFNATLDAITAAVTYVQSLLNAGVTVKVIFVIMTDGEDNAHRATAQDVKTVITDLLFQEIYTFALVGFGTNANAIGQSMGIPADHILDAGASAHDIRMAFNTSSASVIQASQNIVGSSGGFWTQP